MCGADERVSNTPLGDVNDIMRTGNDIVAAGYCMYGAATELVMCFKQVRTPPDFWGPDFWAVFVSPC